MFYVLLFKLLVHWKGSFLIGTSILLAVLKLKGDLMVYGCIWAQFDIENRQTYVISLNRRHFQKVAKDVFVLAVLVCTVH